MFTPDGSRPTRQSAIPLGSQNTLDGGRGSIVWFTQATMLMTAETGVRTMKEAKAKEKKMQQEKPRAEPYVQTTYDREAAIQEGIFPTHLPNSNV